MKIYGIDVKIFSVPDPNGKGNIKDGQSLV